MSDKIRLIDIWLKVYEDSLDKVDPEVAAGRASRAVTGLPADLKKELSDE